jgi:GT2 family glycosyltransferase
MAVALSVIIPCFGHSVELEKCLRALEAQYDAALFEVIVVDSSRDAVAHRFPSVRWIRADSRLFPGAARNLGVRHAAGVHLAFLDADCIPSEDWVREAAAAVQAGQRCAGGPILDVRPRRPIAWVDNRLQFADFQRGRPEGPGEHFPSCNLVMQREVFSKAGGFREELPTGEDVLFSRRVGELFDGGMRFLPQLVVRHHGRETLRGMLDHQRLLGYHRGSLRLEMTPAWQRLARSPWLGAAAVLRRFGYVLLRTWQYDRRGMWMLIFCVPLLLAGLLAWTQGFYRGLEAGEIGGGRT